jgi:hypothetical protein
MVRATGRYQNQRVELDQPIGLADGTSVEVQIRPIAETDRAERMLWGQIGMDRLQEEWDNPADAVYDDWKELYGV